MMLPEGLFCQTCRGPLKIRDSELVALPPDGPDDLRIRLTWNVRLEPCPRCTVITIEIVKVGAQGSADPADEVGVEQEPGTTSNEGPS